ncbi:RhoGAP-domain-containing protein [Testicularia cyperi]|uniref:RhoGAP-domain-containing protein n=1 Tax=Testicularia cyperi TaxID=1882483 RepID=A0A317XTJ5_9BASI|nr:RhoGAP-domain-containing protein [Testicularia cyperi]
MAILRFLLFLAWWRDLPCRAPKLPGRRVLPSHSGLLRTCACPVSLLLITVHVLQWQNSCGSAVVLYRHLLRSSNVLETVQQWCRSSTVLYSTWAKIGYSLNLRQNSTVIPPRPCTATAQYTRPPRFGIDNDYANSNSHDAASNASHGSSSRYAAGIGTRPGGAPTPAPLALAEALARVAGDHVAALDQVLAERNQYCLDNSKLTSENVRIWNLMGRIRKENEALKTKLVELERASGISSATAKGSPLGSSGVAGTPGSPANGRRRLPSAAELERSSSPMSPSRHTRQDSRGESDQHISHSSSAVVAPLISHVRSSTNGDAAAYDSPLTSVDQGPSRASRAVDLGSSALTSAIPGHESSQHNSIIQQRAAAQAQSLALARAANGQHGGAIDSMISGESADFEAIDHDSASGTDENASPPPLASSAQNLDRSRTPIQGSQASGVPVTPVQQQGAVRSNDYERSVLASGPNRNRPEIAPTMIPSSASTRSLVSRIATADERLLRSPGSKRKSKDTSKKSVLAPRLDSSLLRVASVKIQGSNYRSPDRGKEAISFYITVDILHPPASWGLNSMASGEPAPPTSWTVEKSYGDIVGLDAKLRNKVGKKAAQRLAPLPDKSLFKDHAPAKVDQRKALLEIYLQSLMVLELPDKDEVCTFLCTDVVPNRARDPTSNDKDGFLTKKGQNLGRWVTRYYVLRNAMLNYYETRGGAQIGSINIREAQIGRQQKSSSSNEQDENAYRHAFLILEKRAATYEEPAHIARHVLCAESDEERDDWVDVLVRAIAELDGVPSDEVPASPTQAMASMSLSQAGASLGRDGPPPTNGGSGSSSSARAAHEAPFSPSADSSMRRSEREAHMMSPRMANVSLDQSRNTHSSISRIDSLDSASVNRSTNLSAAGSGLPTSASHRSVNEPRSPVASRGAELLDQPGSPGPRRDSLGKNKASISGPMNGAPIPAGYKFGARDEAAPDARKDDKKRFWQGFRGFGHNDKHNREPRPVFGVPLSESIAISSIHEGLALPSVVYRCIEYLEKRNAFLEEGIYRLSGSSAVIKTLKDRFNMEGDVDLMAENQYYDPHAVAGLLKTFLRELPTSVLTRELHMDFMRINELQDRAERVNELGHLVSQLPLANYSLLRTLCSHLIKIIEHSDVNKMNMRNVGIVFSPTLAIGAGIFALFLTEFASVFEVDANGEPAPRRIEEDVAVPEPSELGIGGISSGDDAGGELMQPTLSKKSKRNSVQYRESQADRLLGLEGRSLNYREVEEDVEGIPLESAGSEGRDPYTGNLNAPVSSSVSGETSSRAHLHDASHGFSNGSRHEHEYGHNGGTEAPHNFAGAGSAARAHPSAMVG